MKRSKKAVGAMGKRIMTLAKKIRGKGKSKKWTTCVKEAAKRLKK